MRSPTDPFSEIVNEGALHDCASLFWGVPRTRILEYIVEIHIGLTLCAVRQSSSAIQTRFGGEGIWIEVWYLSLCKYIET